MCTPVCRWLEQPHTQSHTSTTSLGHCCQAEQRSFCPLAGSDPQAWAGLGSSLLPSRDENKPHPWSPELTLGFPQNFVSHDH